MRDLGDGKGVDEIRGGQDWRGFQFLYLADTLRECQLYISVLTLLIYSNKHFLSL